MNRLSVIQVALQFSLGAALILSTRTSAWEPLGLVIAGSGALLLVWAVLTMRLSRLNVLPEVKATTELVTTGPYRWIRHPMYTANLLLALGFVWMPYSEWKLVAWGVLAGVLISKLLREEAYLTNRFPEYEQYRQRTWRLFPPVF